MTATTDDSFYGASRGVKSWLLTKDHKRIGILYLVSITLFFFLGGAFASVIRMELATPAAEMPHPLRPETPYGEVRVLLAGKTLARTPLAVPAYSN